MTRLFISCILLAGLLVAGLSAQQPAPQMPPLLYVRLAGPKGMKVTIYRGSLSGQTFEAPCVVGLRPGFRYRLAIFDMEDFPGEVFYPTLDAHGSLLLAGGMRTADFPAGLMFSNEDFLKVKASAIVKKVVTVERTDTAIAAATRAEEPLELQVSTNRDPYEEAIRRGQPMLVFYMGARTMEPDELVNAPGTILMPGEKTLAAPTIAPPLAWACFPVIDPLAGPMSPAAFTELHDGGDIGSPAGFNGRGQLKGVDPSDTVAAYTDSHGKRQLAVSNRVVLCIPRYIVTRGEMIVAGQLGTLTTGNVRGAAGVTGNKAVAALQETAEQRHLMGLGSGVKASGASSLSGTSIIGRANGLIVVANTEIVSTLDGSIIPPAAAPCEGPLVIIKWPDRWCALVGDILTFTLRYTNSGGTPITDVAVTDSLEARFEYLPGTSKADRAVTFTAQPNEAGSQMLRWEIPGSLLPRESGTITFQVKVR